MKLCPKCDHGFPFSPDYCPICGQDLQNEPSREGANLEGMLISDTYQLAELLGEGAMGFVYRAVHTKLDRSVAIKILKVREKVDEERMALFELEARAISRLNHPHIVSVIDSGMSPGGFPFIVLEYVPGKTLYRVVNTQQVLPLGRIMGIFQQILAAVEEAHSMGVIHRDLKPENIILTELRSGEDFVKVFDFGIATFLDEGRENDFEDGRVFGTLGYISPECLRGKRATPQSDIYGLGAILYEMLAGAPVFTGATSEIIHNQLQGNIPPISNHAAKQDLAETLGEIISLTLAVDPRDRFQSVAAFRRALQSTMRELGPIRLQCDRCTRAIDPDTGLCSLHGSEKNLPIDAKVDPGKSVEVTAPGKQMGDIITDYPAIVTKDLIGRNLEAQITVTTLLSDIPIIEIIGCSGIGKSALSTRLATVAEHLGYEVSISGSRPTPERGSWLPVQETLGHLLKCGANPKSRETLEQALLTMGIDAANREGVLNVFGFTGSTARGDILPDEPVARTMEAVIEVIERARKQSGPLCLIAEDFDQFDRSSAGFFQKVAAWVQGTDNKLIITAKTPFLPDGVVKTTVELNTLEPDEFREILEQRHCPADQMNRLDSQLDASEPQTPFFALAVASIIQEGDTPRGTLADIYRSRLADLPPTALTALHYICIHGPRTPVSLLERLVEDDLLSLAIELLDKRGFVTVDSGRSISPWHEKTAELVLSTLPTSQLKKLHGKVFDFLEEQFFPTCKRAYHASMAGEDELAYSLLELSGDEARGQLDYETAAFEHYRRAMDIGRWRLLLEDDNPHQLQIALKMGQCLATAGHHLAAEVVFKDILHTGTKFPKFLSEVERSLRAMENRARTPDPGEPTGREPSNHVVTPPRQ